MTTTIMSWLLTAKQSNKSYFCDFHNTNQNFSLIHINFIDFNAILELIFHNIFHNI